MKARQLIEASFEGDLEKYYDATTLNLKKGDMVTLRAPPVMPDNDLPPGPTGWRVVTVDGPWVFIYHVGEGRHTWVNIELDVVHVDPLGGMIMGNAD